jgi:hypothetical protein
MDTKEQLRQQWDEMHGRRWIPVTELVPGDDQECLTVDSEGVVRVARFDAIGYENTPSFYEEPGFTTVRATHWMPLPAPPAS